MSDALQALLELCDDPGEVYGHTRLFERFGGIAERLIASGALARCANLASVVCYECDGGHPAKIERDGATGRHWYFCPDAGRVEVDDADLIAFRFDVDWFLAQLAKAIPTLLSRRTTLIEGRAWLLGRAITDRTEWNAVFARHMLGFNCVDSLGTKLTSLPPAELTLVLVSTPAPPRHVPLLTHASFVDLADLACWKHDSIAIDHSRLKGVAEDD